MAGGAIRDALGRSVTLDGLYRGQDPRAKGRPGPTAGAGAGGLLLRGGERVGIAGMAQPRSGRAHMLRLAARLSDDEATQEYGAPITEGMVAHGRAVFLSDFLGDLVGIEAGLARASALGVKGALIQVLDPAEEEFPFDGRTIFESMGGTLRHETQKAGDLRGRYLARLAERKDRLAALARAVGWHFTTHHTGHPAQAALLWTYAAVQGGR